MLPRCARRLRLALFAATLAWAPSTWAHAEEPGWVLGAELHASVLSDIEGRSILAGGAGYGVRAGYRWGSVGIFGLLEHDLWMATELRGEVVKGAVNIGLGVEHLYLDGRARSALAVGPSVLAFDTPLDDAGSVGFFVDLKPIGLRWPVRGRWRVGLDPLGLTVMVPALAGPRLIQIEYRTAVCVTWVLP